MRFLLGLPLLVIPVAIYHVLVLGTITPLDQSLMQFTLRPDSLLVVSWGYFLIGLALVLLYVEIFKSTRTGNVSILDHLFSMLLLLVCVVELIVLPEMGTETFLILTLMTLIDVIAGFTVTISGARRDFSVQSRDVGVPQE